MIPKSLSRIVKGLLVPHFWPENCDVSTKYTSHLKGLLKPFAHDIRLVKTGKFAV